MGEFLSVPIKDKVTEQGEASIVKYVACGMQGWRKRMEDAHVASVNIGQTKQTHLFGVFDGHGGKEVSQFVAAHITEELLANKNFNTNLKTALSETFMRLDEMMVETSGKLELKKYSKLSKEEDEIINQREKQNNKGNKNSQFELLNQLMGKNNEDIDIALVTGCTSCVCAIDEKNKKIYCANAGDSRAVICKKGIAIPLSVDHKPDLDSEKNRIYKAEGWVTEGRVKGNLNLSRSLGDLEYKQYKKLPPAEQMITAFPEIMVENLTPDVSFMVIACDGIWDCMSNQEICDLISTRFKARIGMKEIVEEIMDNCLATDIYNGILF
jgi:protein phosphatase 1G